MELVVEGKQRYVEREKKILKSVGEDAWKGMGAPSKEKKAREREREREENVLAPPLILSCTR